MEAYTPNDNTDNLLILVGWHNIPIIDDALPITKWKKRKNTMKLHFICFEGGRVFINRYEIYFYFRFQTRTNKLNKLETLKFNLCFYWKIRPLVIFLLIKSDHLLVTMEFYFVAIYDLWWKIFVTSKKKLTLAKMPLPVGHVSYQELK